MSPPKKLSGHWHGNGKYRGIDRRIVRCFVWMHDRVKRKAGRSCDFPRTREGIEQFVVEMGPIPKGMRRPSVGRLDHTKGYVHGNVKWEPHSYNAWKERRDEIDNGVPLLAAARVSAPRRWTIDREDWDLG